MQEKSDEDRCDDSRFFGRHTKPHARGQDKAAIHPTESEAIEEKTDVDMCTESVAAAKVEYINEETPSANNNKSVHSR